MMYIFGLKIYAHLERYKSLEFQHIWSYDDTYLNVCNNIYTLIIHIFRLKKYLCFERYISLDL